MSSSSRDHDLATSAATPDGAATIEERLLAAVGGKARFEQSFSGRTFNPDRAAERAVADAAQSWRAAMATFGAQQTPADVVAAWDAKFVKVWLAYQHAGARTLNWMITGPARFPVERNRKRMETEHRRMGEYIAHADGAAEWALRHARRTEKAALSAQAAAVEHVETAFPGGRLVRNAVLDRVQLVFDGRPDAGTIAELKARAFRWSPREGAWQRQLTRNGIWAAQAVVAAISKAEGR